MAKQTEPNKPSGNIQIQGVARSYGGPIPPPDALKHYDEIIPGAADRILAMAENESRHRHAQEHGAMQASAQTQNAQISLASEQTKAAFRSDTIGQILGFAVSLLSIAGAIYLASAGLPWVATALVGLPLAGVIRALRDKVDSASNK